MIVNGKKMICGEKTVINDLLSELNLNSERIVVEIDGKIISKENFKIQKLSESNVIEVISFVGGG